MFFFFQFFTGAIYEKLNIEIKKWSLWELQHFVFDILVSLVFFKLVTVTASGRTFFVPFGKIRDKSVDTSCVQWFQRPANRYCVWVIHYWTTGNALLIFHLQFLQKSRGRWKLFYCLKSHKFPAHILFHMINDD